MKRTQGSPNTKTYHTKVLELKTSLRKSITTVKGSLSLLPAGCAGDAGADLVGWPPGTLSYPEECNSTLSNAERVLLNTNPGLNGETLGKLKLVEQLQEIP